MTDKETAKLDGILLIAAKSHLRNSQGLDPSEFDFAYVDVRELIKGDLYLTPKGLFDGIKFANYCGDRLDAPASVSVIRARHRLERKKTLLYYKVVNGSPQRIFPVLDQDKEEANLIIAVHCEGNKIIDYQATKKG